MYLFFGIFFLILLIFFCLNHRRRKKIICKVRSMCMAEKCRILNDIIVPFGYSYIPSQDIFTSRVDAWQREFGYCALYDDAAPFLRMVFDSLPVYFDYQKRTWLIELWKGQYGINTGCEIGIYNADHMVSQDKIKHTVFHSVADKDMPIISLTFKRDGCPLAHLREKHWWLTAFSMGCFSWPTDLSMYVSITLPNAEMASAFAKGLMNAGYHHDEIKICCCCVSFYFAKQDTAHTKKLAVRFAQWLNRLWCKIYLHVTKPFCLSVDRLLYLYYYLPFAFRRMFRLRRCKKRYKK